ncbi:MAG: pentapeptide repeat-containing protein [Symploca sp. SIO2E9]|nr:pentapeptide repeat-containing protein [Symploca sp. SIO2E9]
MHFKLGRRVKQWVLNSQQYFVRLLDSSVRFRILLSFLVAYTALLALQTLERQLHNSPSCQSPLSCWATHFVSVISVDHLEGFSILVVAILYLLESRDRKKRKHYEAWQIIDQAAATKVTTSYARLHALQDLNEDGISLGCLDVSQADLRGINLRGADLSEATLRGANLKNANLSNANLANANFNEANLQDSNLSGANLKGVYLCDANLARANLKGANLTKCNLSKANLEQAQLEGVKLEDANLAQTNFRNANLTCANLQGARLRENHRGGADFKGANLAGATMPDGTVNL